MRRLFAAIVLIGCMVPATSVGASNGATSATLPPTGDCPKGPVTNPTITVSTATANSGGSVTVTGSGFTKGSTVRMTFSPGVLNFPKNLTSDASGKVSLDFAAPTDAKTYTISLIDLVTGTPAAGEGACGGTAQTTLTVAGVASGGPTTTASSGGSSGSSSGHIPVTGRSTAPLLATALIFASLGLTLVAVARRRRNT